MGIITFFAMLLSAAIMLANYGYSFDITEMTASGSIVHVYRRK